MLAAQLPENTADAKLVLQAMADLMENFLDKNDDEIPAARPSNVLPFAAG